MIGFGDSKARAQRVQGGVDTLVGPQVVLRGDVQFAGGLYLEGQVVGRVLAEAGAAATVTIAQRGRIEGEVRAPVVIVNGAIKGDVHASERLELGPEARVEGTLHYAVIEMAAGAAVTGQLVHVAAGGPGGPAPAKKAAPSSRTTAEHDVSTA